MSAENGPKEWKLQDGRPVGELFRAENRRLATIADNIVHNEHDAADVAGQTWVTTLPHLSSVNEPERYLSRAAANTARSLVRKKEVRKNHGDQPPLVDPMLLRDGHYKFLATDQLNAPSTGSMEDDVLLKIALQKGMSLLSERQREVLECRARGLSEKEIALEIGISRGAVKSHASRARTMLTRFLEEEGYSLEEYRFGKKI